jgi:hypothetical protein
VALPRQNITIPLGVGIDTKTDPKQVAIGKLSVLENGVFTKLKQVQKRFALSPIVQTVLGGSSISSAKQVASLQGELLTADGTYLYGYSPNRNTWVIKGNLNGATVESYGISRGVDNRHYVDSAYTSGFLIIAWEEFDATTGSSNGIFATVLDATTRRPIVNESTITASGSLPRCSATNGILYVHYRDGGNLKVRTFNTASDTFFTAEATVASDLHLTAPAVDVCMSGTNIVLAYRREPSGVKVGILNAAGTFSATTATHSDDPSSIALISYSNSDLANDGVYLVYWDSSGTPSIKALIYNLTLSNSPSPITIGASGGTVGSIGLAQTSASQIQIFISIQGLVALESYISSATLTRLGVASAISVYCYNLWLYSKPVVISGIPHIVGLYPSVFQGGFFLLSGVSNPKILNRISYQNASGYPPTIVRDSLSSICALGSNRYAFSNIVKTSLTSETGEAFSNTGVQMSIVDFDDSKMWQTAELGRQKYFATGMLNQYDGSSISEVGFNVYPEGFGLTNGAGGAVFAAGTRQYIVTYEWVNLNGDIERSAPSIGSSQTNGAGIADITVTGIPYLTLTNKSEVQVCIYRTIANGTTFYKVGTVENNSSLQSFDYVDTTPDSDIVDNELLYTTGGVVDNIPPPSCSSIIDYNGRIIAVGLEDPNAIWFSKDYSIGNVVSFNDSFVMRIDQGRIGVKACGVLDDKLVFFKDDQIFVTAGSGPLITGAQNDFVGPVNNATDVGCPYPRSVVQTPIGLMFKSKKGFYLLDRALQVKYLGAEVEDYNTLTVTSAVLLDKENQVRFTHSDGSCLVYDYFVNQWGVLTNYTSIGACMWNGNYTVASSAGLARQESTTSYLDSGTTAISTHLTTSWVQTGGIEGFQRLYRAVLQGAKNSNHTITVKVGYDFDSSWSETFVFDMSNVSGSLLELEIRPARQKCTAIRFDIADSNPSLIDGAGASFSSLVLECGLKVGTNKIPAARTMVAQ